jgi:predicted dehydrogenase
MLSPTAEYLKRHNLELGAEVDMSAPDNNTMIGRYSSQLQNLLKEKKVGVVGGGEVYQKMIGPALKHLGIEVYLFDPNKNIKNNFSEVRVDELGAIPNSIPVFILSPNKFHVDQTEYFTKRGNPIVVEKPACLAAEVGRLRSVVDKSEQPTYWIDFNHMMARSFIALAGGVKMPFMDVVKIENDSTGKITESIKNNIPLINGKIKKITGRYIQKASGAGGTTDHRPWLRDAREGGGVMRDMMTRLFNISQLIGFKNIELKKCDKHSYAGRSNKIRFKDVPNLAEDHAKVTGVMNGAEFDFEVGKYAVENNLHYTIEYDSGDVLKLEWLPPNRKNRVTWTKNGEVQGAVFTDVDPYLLVVLDALTHCRKVGVSHMYFEEQVKSVEIIGKAAELSRASSSTVLTRAM